MLGSRRGAGVSNPAQYLLGRSRIAGISAAAAVSTSDHQSHLESLPWVVIDFERFLSWALSRRNVA
jgi:hypothetical protein